MTYDRIKADELQGTTQADYLVSLDADFRITDGDETVFAEPSFPVVELARSMLRWLDESDRGDFKFESMSFEELGSVTIRRFPAGWCVGSVFAPESWSAAAGWEEVERCVQALVSKVERDLLALGIDPAEVIRR